MKEEQIEPAFIKAGDSRILINGTPPFVDCRIVSEDHYQKLIKPEPKEGHNQNLFEALQDVCNFIALDSDMHEILLAIQKDLELNQSSLETNIQDKFRRELEGLIQKWEKKGLTYEANLKELLDNNLRYANDYDATCYKIEELTSQLADLKQLKEKL